MAPFFCFILKPEQKQNLNNCGNNHIKKLFFFKKISIKEMDL